ncbi:MAG: UDP-glucose 4-epimerase GalE [Novosphingobium sp.]|nr:UDP-glucose 4-epimerase GalE [Novosphingobium sp.]
MKVLVTGGAGYIGSHSCKALAAAGHEVVVYDSLVTGHAHAVKWGPLEIGDIRDRERLEGVVAQHDPDLVMHFAALAYVGESMREPALYFDVNVSGTLTLLEIMLARGKDRIIFSSSCATYGIPQVLPIGEDTPQLPVNPYGFTKLAGERMLADFEQAYGLRWAALRYFNAAGADPDGELGEEHSPETHAVPLAVLAALGKGPAFRLLGRDFDTPDGTAVRDFVHVSDLAEAHLLAAEHLAGDGRSIALNIGTGQGTSVLAVLEAIETVTGRAVPFVDGERRGGDPPSLYADVSLAREVLGWTAKYTKLEDIAASAIDWFDCAG